MITTAHHKRLTPHFSGHETFPLRQMWLKKAVERATPDWTIPKSTFTDKDAIAHFGVGKNMVAAIKHWALACEVMNEDGGAFKVTPFGREIFGRNGRDPYSEDPATAWFVHWQLAARGARSTTWFWLFNHVFSSSFTREDLETPLTDYADSWDPKRKPSPITLRRDIETCLRSYAPRAGASPEDYAEPMLGELGLISEEVKGRFAFRRGQKTTLPDGMFAYALIDYWNESPETASTLSFESIAYGEGSPGRVFKLDEDSIAERLLGLEELTNGALALSDTAGLRQLHRKEFDPQELMLTMVGRAYD